MFIVIFKRKRKLYALSARGTVLSADIALGKCPVGDKRGEGDNRTPVGFYTVCVKNPKSKYHLSLGLSYPNPRDALLGLIRRKIDLPTFRRILSSRTKPPYDTPLGGFIMIHGYDKPRQGDWTAGCIAIANEKMDFLFAKAGKGTRVMII